MGPLLRYTLLQLPGLAVAGFALVLLWREAGLPGWAAAALLVLWVAKDAAMYPFVRDAYAADGGLHTERLIGQRGVARQPLAPRGYVALRGALWRAELAPGEPPVVAGDAVRIVGARRLTLIVTREDATPTS